MHTQQARALLSIAAIVFAGLGVAPAAAEDLLIGQVSSQTSPTLSSNAKALYAGINVYFDHVNSGGGIDGRKLKLINKDDEFVSAKLVELTKEFIADKNVIALAGYQNSGGIGELSKQNIPGTAGIAMIAPFQGDKSIVGAANFFPFRSGYADEVAALVKEAKNTEKKNVVLIYQNMTFGPAVVQVAQQLSRELGLNIVDYIPVDTKSQNLDFASSMVSHLARHSPDAIMVLVGGKHVLEIVKEIKETPALDGTQLYLMSIVPAQDVVKTIGEEKARGIVISQVVPFPFSATLPLVGEYQKLMKQFAPAEPLSFSSLEGFVIGKITAEAVKRASPRPTREKVLKVLNNMGELDLGGVRVSYTQKRREGWGGVELTVIGPNGKLLR